MAYCGNSAFQKSEVFFLFLVYSSKSDFLSAAFKKGLRNILKFCRLSLIL